MIKYITLTILVFFASFAQAQEEKPLFSPEDLALLKNYEDTLGLMGHLIVNDSLEENRFVATRKMIKTLVNSLKIENSFDYPFEQIKTMSIQYPADSTFRIFTWQLYVNKDDYRYYGAIQMNTSDLQLFPLIDRSVDLDNSDYETLSPENWYGAVYYNLKEFDTPKGKNYLLFGFDAYSFFDKRKIIDVLSFENGKPLFGAPVLMVQTNEGNLQPRNRFILEYSSEASIGLNYDESAEKIVYNHLMMISNPFTGLPTYIPSGSYDGFQLINGLWVYEEELFKVITPEGEYPRPEPVLDKRKGKGILGN